MKKIKIITEKFSISGANIPVKPKVAADCLLGIYRKKKDLTPQLVLDEAKNSRNPLHKCFEWDNTKAAQKYRLSQARDLIRCIVIEKKIGNEKKQVRAFVNIRRDESGELSTSPFAAGKSTYMYVDNALSNTYLAKYTIDKALMELNHIMEKYETLKELAGLFGRIRREINKIKPKKSA